MSQPQPQPPRIYLILAFAAVYLIWGSTYLAIRFSIQSFPPFLMSGVRYFVAGSIMYIIARASGSPAPLRVHWRSAAIIGALLLLMGNGLIAWAEEKVPSGMTALMVATVPLWFVVLYWLFFNGPKPSLRIIAGLILGFGGIFILIGPDQLTGDGHLPFIRLAAIVIATIGWTFGSLYAKGAKLPSSAVLVTGMQMFCGGVFMVIAGSLKGEWADFQPAQVSYASIVALVYLIIFGSMIGFSAYSWLVRVAPPSKVSTYAYVNPVIAVFLGWAMGGEKLQWYALVGAAAIVLSVIIITSAPKPVKSEA
jgi:drug/metabolite transporter (DMT)-like permease